jgi:Uri superfamily endonuclease
MDKGIYCLVFKNPGCTVRIGALGPVAFTAGWHLYVGSALGSGGLARQKRHIALARKRDRRPKWHVDYLLMSDHFSLRYAVTAATSKSLECDLARSIGGRSVPGFGCSDCSCISHLFYRQKKPVREVEEAFRSLCLDACTKTLMYQ